MASVSPRQPFIWGRNPQYPLNRRLSEPQSQSECFGEDRNFFSLPEISLSQVLQPVSQSLYRLRHLGSYTEVGPLANDTLQLNVLQP